MGTEFCTCWPGSTVWLTGLPSAGKSTIARMAADRLRRTERRVEVLDGDEIRAALWPDTGFTRKDREAHVRRVGLMAEVLARNGVTVLVPVIAPYRDSRAEVREHHRLSGTAYLEVHVSTPLDVCAARDVKGLYAKQASGEISGLTGVDDSYEMPEAPDLRLEAHEMTVEQCVDALTALLVDRGLAK